MKTGLHMGDTFSDTFKTDSSMGASLLGQTIHPGLLGTATLVEHMEWAARQHILPFLETGEEGVGHKVSITHSRPCALGSDIKVVSEVTDITDKTIASYVRVYQASAPNYDRSGDLTGFEPLDVPLEIGAGNVTQALVQAERFYAKGLGLKYNNSKETASTTSSNQPTDDYQSSLNTILEDEANLQSSVNTMPKVSDKPFKVEEWVTLSSVDNATHFALSLVQYESPYPCSEYDEWIITSARLQQKDQPDYEVQGAYLLRMEVEQVVNHLTTQPLTSHSFQFLENVFQLRIEADGKDTTTLHITLDDTNIPRRKTYQGKIELSFKISSSAVLTAFAEKLKRQLDAFPAHL